MQLLAPAGLENSPKFGLVIPAGVWYTGTNRAVVIFMIDQLAKAPWIIPLAAVFLISAIVLVNRKRKHPASKSEPAGPLPGVGDSAAPETDMLWGGDAVCRVRLTDVHLPEHSYERTVKHPS